MIRSITSVFAGFALWSVLWLALNAALVALFPGSFSDTGMTQSSTILAGILLASVVLSVLSGRSTALLARRRAVAHSLVLGLLLLAVGIAVQLQYWDAMPLWYHAAFLFLLVPAGVAGGLWQVRSG